MHAPPERDEVWLNRGIVAVVLAVVFFVAARTHADPDLWGHVRFGQDILAGGIPSVDPYSYVSGDYPWINHELLAEISFAAAFDAWGAPGLVGLKVALVLITLGLVLGARYQGGVLGVAVLLLCAVLLAIPFGALSNALALTLRKQESVIGAVNFVLLPLVFLSPVFMAPALMPEWIRNVSLLNPVGWSVTAGRAALHGNADWRAVALRIGCLGGFTLMSGWLATRAFQSYQRSV